MHAGAGVMLSMSKISRRKFGPNRGQCGVQPSLITRDWPWWALRKHILYRPVRINVGQSGYAFGDTGSLSSRLGPIILESLQSAVGTPREGWDWLQPNLASSEDGRIML